jgi:hypothetical protein
MAVHLNGFHRVYVALLNPVTLNVPPVLLVNIAVPFEWFHQLHVYAITESSNVKRTTSIIEIAVHHFPPVTYIAITKSSNVKYHQYY